MRFLALASVLAILLTLPATPAAAQDPAVEPDLPSCRSWTVGGDTYLVCTVGDDSFGCVWSLYEGPRAACGLPTPCPTDVGASVQLGPAQASTDGCGVAAGVGFATSRLCDVTADLSDADPLTVTCVWGDVFGFRGVSCTVQGRDPVVATCTPLAPCFVADFWTEGLPSAGAFSNDCTLGAWADPDGVTSPCVTTLSEPSTTTCQVGRHTVRCTVGFAYGVYCTNDALPCGRHVDEFDLGPATVYANTCRGGVVLDHEHLRDLVHEALPATSPADPPGPA